MKMKKSVCLCISVFLILVSVLSVPGFALHSQAARSYPIVIFMEDPDFEVPTGLFTKMERGNTENAIRMTWYPAFKNEGYDLVIYNPQGYEVGKSSKTFSNNTSDIGTHFTLTWNTTNLPLGRYKVEVTVKFYSLYRWNEAPEKETLYIDLVESLTDDSSQDNDNENTSDDSNQDNDTGNEFDNTTQNDEKLFIPDDAGKDVPEGYAMMFRLYNSNSGEHFYTSSKKEGNKLVDVGWKYEGKAWIAPTSGDPVYRLYNGNTGDHHYTMSKKERDNLIRVGWKDEGIGWYSLPKGTGTPLYRLYNPNCTGAGSHHYTSSNRERESLVKQGWNDEGIAWYGL